MLDGQWGCCWSQKGDNILVKRTMQPYLKISFSDIHHHQSKGLKHYRPRNPFKSLNHNQSNITCNQKRILTGHNLLMNKISPKWLPSENHYEIWYDTRQHWLTKEFVIFWCRYMLREGIFTKYDSIFCGFYLEILHVIVYQVSVEIPSLLPGKSENWKWGISGCCKKRKNSWKLKIRRKKKERWQIISTIALSDPWTMHVWNRFKKKTQQKIIYLKWDSGWGQ